MVDLSLLQDFITETTEYLEVMEDILLRLEADPGNRKMLDDVFRSLHTIKGAAEYLGIERVSRLSRTLENMLYYPLRKKDIMVSKEMIDILMEGQTRIALLTDNLHKTQTEQVEIDDLIERIQVIKISSQLSETAEQGAVDKDNRPSAEESTKETTDLKENDDENDAELFRIFLNQLEEKLAELQTHILDLHESDSNNTRITILDNCLSRIKLLNSSADYMGYNHLILFCKTWENEIQIIKKQLNQNDESTFAAFISDCMEANVTRLINRYPKLQTSTLLETQKDPNAYYVDKTSTSSPRPAEEKISENVEPRDLLEEYAETTSSSAPATETKINHEVKSKATLFEQLSRSFDNRIKKNIEQLSKTDQVEIESELFSAAEPPTSNPDISLTDPEITTAETTFLKATDNQTNNDNNYKEEDESENDEELFDIFNEEFEEKITNLKKQTAALKTASDDERIIILNICLEQIDRLGSSSNYMGYEHLTTFLEEWSCEVAATQAQLQSCEDNIMASFITDCMQVNIEAVLNHFSHLTDSEEEPPVTTTAERLPSGTVTAPDLNTAFELISNKKTPTEENGTEELQGTISDLTMLPDFIIETQEHLEVMEESILGLYANPDKQKTLNYIFRSIHTIKSSADYLHIKRIAKLTHNFENLLHQLRQEQLPVTREVIDLLLAGRDRIGLLTNNLEQHQSEQAEIGDLLERVRIIDGSSKSKATANINIEAVLKTENTALLQGTDRRAPYQASRRQSDHFNEKTLKQNIRVDTSKIDALMNKVNELAISRAGFTDLLTDMQDLQQELEQHSKVDMPEMRRINEMTFRLSETTSLFDKLSNELQEEIMNIRILPLSQLFDRFPRLVFDLGRDTGKQVELDIHGEDTELDRMVIEEISDPLVHIIRNAVDHGIESTSERLKNGKPEIGTIRLSAHHENKHVVIKITDDGRGLDLNRIKEKALSEKFVSHNELEHMSTREITAIIMKPGFSMNESVTHLSGRGVGMDVVKKNIEKLNGTIEIDTIPGVSMSLQIKIPLTLAIIPALIIRVSSKLISVPLSTVEETLRLSQENFSIIQGIEVMSLRGENIPLVRMVDLFNSEKNPNDLQQDFVVVISSGIKRLGLIVDELLGREEIVVKPLEDNIQAGSAFSGTTILGDGRSAFILDVYELIKLPIKRKIKNKPTNKSVLLEIDSVEKAVRTADTVIDNGTEDIYMDDDTKKILLINCDPGIRKSITNYLDDNPASYRLLSSAADENAFTALAAENIFLVVLCIEEYHDHAHRFLQRMIANYRELEIILVLDAAQQQKRSAIPAHTCLHILEKPLGPFSIEHLIEELSSNKHNQGLTGSLQSVQLDNLLQMFCLAGTTVNIRVNNDLQQGTISIKEGEIIHAECGEMGGEEALYLIMTWHHGSFETLEPSVSDTVITINENHQYLFLEAARLQDEANKDFTLKEVQTTAAENIVFETETKKLRVLLVDDSMTMTKIMSTILLMAGDIDVAGTARNGKEALEMLETLKFDVILLDVNMPVMNGRVTMKNVMLKSPCPIVIMSNVGSGSFATILSLLDLGAVDFISKPVKGGDILIQQRKIVERVRRAATSRASIFRRFRSPKVVRSPAHLNSTIHIDSTVQQLVIISSGCSGHGALYHLIAGMPESIASSFVSLNSIPVSFLTNMASHISHLCHRKVTRITDGISLHNGQFFLDAQRRSLSLQATNNSILARSLQEKDDSGYELSYFDLFLTSAADLFQDKLLIVLLSGAETGDLNGLRYVRENGGTVFVQNRSSCVVPDFMQPLIEENLIDEELKPELLASRVVAWTEEEHLI